MDKLISLSLLFSLLFSCTTPNSKDIDVLAEGLPAIQGKEAYLNSPFVTAGDRVYLVGHQDGSFPELGWHITGEMGGLWDHPIKLMDGFEAAIQLGEETLPLDNAHTFTNYPMTNRHSFAFADQGLEVDRWQFVPDGKEGIAIQFILRNTGSAPLELSLSFTGHADLRPTWLGERTGMEDGEDEATYIEDLQVWQMQDENNPWFVLFGGDKAVASSLGKTPPYAGKGTSGLLEFPMEIAGNGKEVLTVVIAGSYRDKEEVKATYLDIHQHMAIDFNAKKDRYQELASRSKLTIPDKDMQATFEWLKYNCDWLIRDVPEVGKGIMAGIPDYPWWFGVDSEYSLKGYMAIGREDVVLPAIELLHRVSDTLNGNGQIIHEMSTNGAVFNPGNINETPQFASLIWEVYRWNGDKAFLQTYFPIIQQGLAWLMKERDTDGNGFPEGFGMMEIHGLDSEMIDVAAYTQRAFADAARIASTLGKEDVADQYAQTALELKDKINTYFWSEEFESYADFIGTDKQALHLIEDAIVRADTLGKPWAIEELEATRAQVLQNPSSEPKPFVMHHNWVVNTPMEMGIADSVKALKALEIGRRFVNPFGVFVTGIDRDESAGSDDGSFAGSKAFSYTGAVMTLPTGVQVVAENNYGRPDMALDYLKRMTRSFSFALPGSMYEVSPDYGMITQAWNIYSFAVPIVQQFFGIQPDAANKQVDIRLALPSEWEEASLEEVMVSDNSISIFVKKAGDEQKVRITQTRSDWALKVHIPAGAKVERGKLVEEKGAQWIESEGREVVYFF